MNIAIILAGGTGKRMGSDIPKQFFELDGKTVIEHSIDAFEQADGIDEITVVVHPSWMEHMKHIASNREWKKLTHILEGGEERYFSSLNAIAAHLDYPDDTNLIMHDAARPWITQDIICRVLKAMEEHEAVGVGVPSTDTVWEVRRANGCGGLKLHRHSVCQSFATHTNVLCKTPISPPPTTVV